MTSGPPYPSPNEERAPRRGGKGFYRDRGRKYPGPTGHEERDRKRTPEDRESAALARDLAVLAHRYERFAGGLNRLRHHVLVQARTPAWKRRAINECLRRGEHLAIEEIAEETHLDRQSITTMLAQMLSAVEVERVDRDGVPVVIRTNGRPASKVYWRIFPHSR